MKADADSQGCKDPCCSSSTPCGTLAEEIRTCCPVLLNKAHTLSNPCPYTTHQHTPLKYTQTYAVQLVTQDSKGPKCEPAFSGAATATLWWSQERRLITGLQMRGQGCCWVVVGGAHTHTASIQLSTPVARYRPKVAKYLGHFRPRSTYTGDTLVNRPLKRRGPALVPNTQCSPFSEIHDTYLHRKPLVPVRPARAGS